MTSTLHPILVALLICSCSGAQPERKPGPRQQPTGCDIDSFKAPTESHFVQRNIIRIARPVYPEQAAKQGVEGVVNVDILVDKSGTVIRACALSGPSPLYKAAEQAALACKFKKNFGSPHAVRTGYRRDVLPYMFVLDRERKVGDIHYIVVRPEEKRGASHHLREVGRPSYLTRG